MPPALDRLLASPSALRLLRLIVTTPELPAACSTAARCCNSITSRRSYSNNRTYKQKWRRWQDAQEEIVSRDKVRRLLEAEDTTGNRVVKLDVPLLGTLSEGKGKGDDASWAATLAHRERLQRLRGVKSTWRECRQRGYRLPIDDTPDAEFLWATFIKHPELVVNVIDHAAETLHETGKTYPRLYELVMSAWLLREPRHALEYHHKMLVKLNLRKLPLRDLAILGRSTFRPPAYEALMDIYRNSNERDLYDEIIPALIERGNTRMARRWHMLCTFRNDMPSESVARHPLVNVFMAEASTISATEVHFEMKKTSKKRGQPIGAYNKELMQRLLGRDTAPVRFEDSFCARMFATRSFPPGSIIQGLAMVGVNEIGPQAVLAMALRTRPVEDLPTRFEELKSAGISLQGCVFSIALEKFAMEQRWRLVRSMLETDQHPDVFGDAEVQRALLEHYLDREDFVQAQRTLAILSLFHNDSSAASWNMLLQIYIKRSGPQHVMEVLQDMRTQGVMVSLESIIAIKGLLRHRRPGHKPGRSTHGKFDDLRFVTRIYISILESGTGAIFPSMWREIICRFGMLGRFRELRRLLLWLLSWYAPRSNVQFVGLPESPFRQTALKKLRATYPETNHYFHFPAMVTQNQNPYHPLRRLFQPSLQQALIVWGFRAGLLANAGLEQSMLGSTLGKKHYRRRLLQRRILNRLDWSIGLRTVVQLRDLGVNVHHHTVLKALQMQFIVMFGRGRSKKKENRLMEKANTIPYAVYVNEVNRIWGSELLKEPQSSGTDMLHEQMWHPRLRRKPHRPASINLGKTQRLGVQKRPGRKEVESNASGASHDNGIPLLEELQKHSVSQARGSGV
ncbi:hypothetical protein BKA66DRAFT_471431 [Pyrenochaeta sp. MPI-SDFR-AT-0127]|nr:hypothetical protein BKA66DRAFT_471431 [Pyrenochaeta sp. MPI-SDFR-AT-0127]